MKGVVFMELVLKKGDVIDLVKSPQKDFLNIKLLSEYCSEDDICALIIDSSGSIVNFSDGIN